MLGLENLDNIGMLGKGLESLIPPQKKNDGITPADGTSATPQNIPTDDQAPSAAPQPPPHILPVEFSEKELPAPEEEKELPAPPEHDRGEPAPIMPEGEPQQESLLKQEKINSSYDLSPYPERSGRAPGGGEAVFQIEVEMIQPNPHQPRRTFDDQGLRDLAASIREFGILQPLTVSKVQKEGPNGLEVGYQLIAGERRLMAAKLLGLERVPVIIRRVDVEQEKLELAIIENLQRENLNPIEMGRAFQRLQEEFRLTQREIASRLGKSREVVANTVRLLDLPPRIQDAISKGEISESHGRLLLGVSGMEAQAKLFEDLVSRHLSTRELRDRVNVGKEKAPAKRSIFDDPEFRALQEKLTSDLGTPVTISQSGTTGKITISFYSREELDNILRKIGGSDDGGIELPIA